MVAPANFENRTAKASTMETKKIRIPGAFRAIRFVSPLLVLTMGRAILPPRAAAIWRIRKLGQLIAAATPDATAGY
jgi:hypothetical protein